MSRLQRSEDAQAEAGDPRRWKGTVGADELDERRAIEQFHHDERLTGVVHDVENRHRGRVIQPGGSLRLAQDPRARRLPLRHRYAVGQGHLFDGDIAAQEEVLAPPHHGHPPAAQPRHEQVPVGYTPQVASLAHGAPRYRLPPPRRAGTARAEIHGLVTPPF